MKSSQKLDADKINRIKEGFKIIQVVIKDQDSNEVFWDSKAHLTEDIAHSSQLLEAHLPARTLQSKAITRSVTFSSVEQLGKLHLKQKASLGNEMVESFNFSFGFVIPNSTNNWDQTILSAGPGKMVPIHMLSGKLEMCITFYEGDETLFEIKLRIFYD